MGDSRKQAGFTLIELLIVLAIVGVLTGIAVSIYVGNIGDVKLRGDVRSLNQAMQLAKMRAMSTGVAHGVAIERRGGNSDPAKPGRIVIFTDCDRNFLYSDNDTDPANNTPIATMETCRPGGINYDPMIAERDLVTLQTGIYFTTFLGSKTPAGAPLESVVFDIMGQCYQGVGNLIEGPVMLQHSSIVNGLVGSSGIQIMGGTGVTQTITIRRVEPDAWGP
jgi:prepilin-type N-terminal cleavage/methylation domain-containing protein